MIQLPPEDPDDLLERLNRETRRLHVPRGFDPLTASQAERDQFGLPPRPDPEHEPELFGFWRELFSSPLSFEEGDFSFVRPQPHNFQRAGTAGARSRHESSLNWSGAYIIPRDGRMFTQVLGSWQVPPVAAPAGRPPSAEYRSSTWIGLDGQRSYLNSTLPQIGTAQFLNAAGYPPGPVTISWIQWWPLPPLTIGALQVARGDRMLCWLLVLNRTDVLFIIKNQMRNQMLGPLYMFIMRAPRVIMPPQILLPVQTEVSGATAEWVMERPTSLVTNQLYALPDYGQVEFRQCYAVSARAPGSPGRLERLIGPTLISMFRVEQNVRRRATMSKARRPLVPPGLSTVRTTFV